MDVQVSHRVYSKVQKEGNLRRIKKRHPRVYSDTVQIQRSRNHRRTYDDRSCPSAGEYTTKNERVKFHGIPEGKERTDVFDEHANLKYKYGNRHFWAEGYYVSTVGLNEATIKKYIAEQDKHDIALDKLSVKEYEDPFKGGR